MKLAVVGATGLVGREILKVLEERKIHPSLFIPVASSKSWGKVIRFHEKEFMVTGHEEAIRQCPDIAIFSAGGKTSKEWAPEYADAGITVIDNSSAWRMEDHVPLVVPEINASILTSENRIIANPNCSTIQMVLALAPLHRKYRIRRIVVSTYQSVTGTGAMAVRQLENERKGLKGEMAYPHPIDLNLIPHGGFFLENGYTSEEVKLENETRKILGDPEIGVSATVVRVPVYGGHSEAVNVEFHEAFDIDNVLALLSSVGTGGSSQFLKELAVKIKERILMLSVSTNPPEIKLPDINGRQYTLNDFSDKFLLISFARSDNSFSIAEYGILNTWLNRYREKLQVVTILRDNDFRRAVSRMSDYGFSWIMLDGSSADMLEYLYDVKLYPSFLLIDQAGLIVMRNCPFPSENLEALIGKISGKGLK